MQLQSLIAQAASIVGSEYRIAKELQIPQSYITQWKQGTRTCSAEDRAILAEMAGVDPWPEIAQAMEERWAGKPKGDRLRALFAKRLEAVRNL
jgi:DNA-binding transcriptional regulator YdaS (Cro superfamily)